MNDVRRVLDDDALLDQLARGERPDGSGTAEDVLLALRADAVGAVAGAHGAPLPGRPVPPETKVPPPAAVPVPRVVRARGALAGSLVAAAVLAATSGVAAAVTGDPLAGLSGVREAARVASAPDGRPPLLRSREGARLHLEVERVAGLIAAGRVDEARDALAAMPSPLSGLDESEQRLLRAELATTAPDLVEAAGLVDPGRPGGAPGRGTGPTAEPGLEGVPGSGPATTTVPPTRPGSPGPTTKPPKSTKPPKTGQPAPPTTAPATTAPVRRPPVTPPRSSAPSTSSAPPTGTGDPTAPTTAPTTQAAGKPSKPPKPPKPPKTKGADDEVPVAVEGLDLAVRLSVSLDGTALLLVRDPSGTLPVPG